MSLLSVSKHRHGKQPADVPLLEQHPNLTSKKAEKRKKLSKKKKKKKKVNTKAEISQNGTKLATSTLLVLSLCPNLLTAANPWLTLHRNERWILGEWVYWAIVLTALFWGNFLAYCSKKKILRTGIKWRLLATVGRRRSFGGIQEGVKMICRPFLLSDHLKCE